MVKNKFILKVVDLQSILDNPNIKTSYDFDRDWVEELINEDGYTISISAWELGENFMIDQHITGLYPELIKLGIEELQEGDMYYSGNLSLLKLVSLLRGLGYTVSTETHSTNNDTQKTTQLSVDDLRTQMNKAVDCEDYEEAVRLRDIIKNIPL